MRLGDTPAWRKPCAADLGFGAIVQEHMIRGLRSITVGLASWDIVVIPSSAPRPRPFSHAPRAAVRSASGRAAYRQAFPRQKMKVFGKNGPYSREDGRSAHSHLVAPRFAACVRRNIRKSRSMGRCSVLRRRSAACGMRRIAFGGDEPHLTATNGGPSTPTPGAALLDLVAIGKRHGQNRCPALMMIANATIVGGFRALYSVPHLIAR